MAEEQLVKLKDPNKSGKSTALSDFEAEVERNSLKCPYSLTRSS